MQIGNPHEHRLTLAIDPGTRQMGVAVYDYTTIHKTFTIKGPAKIKDADLRFMEMLRMMEEQLGETLRCDTCQHSHLDMVFEDPQYIRMGGKARPIEALFRAAGMLHYWGRHYGMSVHRYKVGKIKAGISGRVSASKPEIERIVTTILPGTDPNLTDDVYDALSIGMYHLDQRFPGCFGTALPYVES